MKNNKRGNNKTANKVQKAVIAPVVVAGLLVNSVSPTIALASPLLVEIQKSEVVVVYKNESGKQKVLDNAIEVKDQLGSLKAISVVMTESSIRSLEKDPDIGYVERKLEQKVELLGTPGQWNVEAVNAPKAWEQGYTGQGVKVAIIDSGIGVHADLPNVVQRLSFTQSEGAVADVAPYDNNGHGTHVAGIVGAKVGGATSGGKDFVGVAPNVSLYSLKVVDGANGTALDVIEAIDWAIANNMDVINLSLGLSTHVQLLQDAVDRAYQAGIVVVGAAGNDGNGTPVNYPAKYDSVIAVGSVDQSKTISSFSSTGAEVEFSAPGGAVSSTYMSGGTATYATVGGTSQASPHVAGFVALLMQKDPSKSANEIRAELQNYVDDLGQEGRDTLYGHGFINYLAYDETAPAEVTSLQATEKTQDSITVSWTNPTDVDFAKTVILSNGVVVGETTDKTQNTFKIEQLKPATEYNIVVKTLDAKGNESVGATLLVTTEADTVAPAEVTDLAVTEATTNSAVIGFALPADADFAKANVYIDGVLNGETTTGSYSLQNLNPSTDYTVVVKTVDANGNESVGQTIVVSTQAEADVTAPAEVTGLAVSDITSDSFLVTWTNPSDADFLTAVIYQDGEQVASSEDGTFLFEWMESNTEYQITVKTMDAEGNESVGQTITVKTEQKADTTAPAEVSNLTATEVTHNSAKLTFTNPSDADYTSSLIYVNGEYVGETTTGEYVLTGLDPLTEYQVEVRTIDGSLNESVGQGVAITTVEVPDTTAPAEVTGITPVDVTHNAITVSYVNPSDADFAKVHFYVNGEFAGESTAMTHTFDNLSPETAYDIEIRTVDLKGNESAGTSARIYTVKEPDVTAPAEVTGLTATSVSADRIEISFTKPSDADYAKANVYVDGVFVGSTTSNNYAVEGLDSETQYEVAVKTVDAEGNESVGQVITVKTPDVTAPNEVTELQVSNVTGTSALVTFNNPSNTDFAFANVFVNGVLAGVTTDGSFELSNLDSETSYTVKVTTVDEAGNESIGQSVMVNTLDVTAPGEVTDLQATNVTGNSATITFNNPATTDFAKANLYLDGVLVGESTTGTFELNNLDSETSYAVKVTTVDANGNESIGQTVTVDTLDVTAPAEVTGLTATSVSADHIEISFTNPSDEDFAKANIYVDGELAGSTTSNGYAIEGVNSETQYEIVVKTVDADGNESVGQAITVKTPDVTAPNEVTELQVSNVTGTSALLTFNNPSNTDFAFANVFVNGELVGVTTEGTYELPNLDSETSYTIKVTTVDNTGNESNGQTVTVHTLDITAPNEVTGLVSESTTDSITVSFTAPSDEDFVQTNFYLNGQLAGSTTSGTFTFEGLTAETSYSIVAKTVDANGNESDGVTVTTATKEIPDTFAPAEVTGLEALDVTFESMNLSFGNPSDEDFAKATIYVNGELAGETTSGTFQLSDLTAETSYEITVKTVDALGNESVGQTINVTTKEVPDTTAPAEVTGLEANATTNSAIITFTNPSDADFAKANVYVNGQLHGETTSGTYELSNLTTETTYEVVVKTVDVKGNESAGSTISVVTEAEPVVEEPTEPTPTEPTEPSEPSDPTPTEPTEPEEPSEPTPTEPTQPEEPTEPEQPVDPEPTPEPVDEIAPAEVTDALAKDITTTSAVIVWTNPTDADFAMANIYVNGEKVQSVEKGQEATFAMNNLTAETSYTVSIKTVDEAGNESVGQVVTFITDKVVVEEPTEPTPTEPTEPTEPSEPAEPGEPSEPTPTEPTPEEPSEPVEPEPTPEPPVDETAPADATDVQATEVSTNSAVISWENPTDVDFAGMNIYVDGVLVKTLSSGETTFTLENLDANKEYKVVLKAVDENGNETVGIELVIATQPVVEEPSEPTQPEEPGEPTPEPTEPEEPTTPPTEPTQPEEPTNPPTEPSQPEEPVTPPSEPSEPEQPPVVEPTNPPVVEPAPEVPTQPTEPIEETPTPDSEDEEKGFFEKLKDSVMKVFDAIVDFLTPDGDNKKPLELEDFGLAYEFKNQLTPEQQEQLSKYKASIRIQEVTAEGNVKFSELNSVSANQKIKLTLANAIDPDSLDMNDVFVRHNGEIVEDMAMVASEDGKTITFIPSESFEPGKYTLFIDNKDLLSIDGASIDNPVVVVFNLQ